MKKTTCSQDTCPYCGAWRGEKSGVLGKEGFICHDCLDSELGITYKYKTVKKSEQEIGR